MLKKLAEKLFSGKHERRFSALDILKFIGPGLLVTVGFIDPGNWASNVAAGSSFGYSLLWIVTLSTVMLIMLQHNAAHLGIATGYCLSESASIHLRPWLSRTALSTAILASVATLMAEILGGAIALNMLFRLPIKIGAVLTAALSAFMLFSNSYKKLEKWIIGFVSLIGLSFIFEITLMKVSWSEAAVGWFKPSLPSGSILIVMSILGAVVMPHNLFLHSEIIQSRQWNLEDDKIRNRQLKYEFLDTLFSMLAGWAINSAMIIIAAATFFAAKIPVTDLQQADTLLKPMLGNLAAVVFACALLLSGISSSITAGMAGGSIFAGIFKEPYNIQDRHSKTGVALIYILAVLVIFFIQDPFYGLIYSQMMLGIQLPITIFLQIYLTSSKKIMGKHANSFWNKLILLLIGGIVTALNIILLLNYL